MSGHSHEEHHSNEPKPVAFSVPFYLAAAMLLILFFFLSLCDPKSHHEAEHGHENPAHADFKGHEQGRETKGSVEAPAESPEGEATRAGAPAEAPAQEAHH
jgi:hypothetical protein